MSKIFFTKSPYSKFYILKSSENGQLMVESIVAISVGMMGLLGILTMLGYSLHTNRDVGRKFVATYLAAEGIEAVKSLIDKNYMTSGCSWNGGTTGCISIAQDQGDGYQVSYDSYSLEQPGGPLLFNSNNSTYGYSGGNPTPFTRIITIGEKDNDNKSGTDEIIVHSIVSWTENGISEEVNLEDHFFDWRL